MLSTLLTILSESIICVPGLEALSESDQAKAYARLQSLEYESRNLPGLPWASQANAIRHIHTTSHGVDDALLAALQDMTPPPDSEADAEEYRPMEDTARKALEEAGCPPCYPTDVQYPLKDVPEQYREIVSYWESFAGTNHMVLCAQLSDFEQFLRTRKKCRQRRPDPGQQGRLENWIEFQDYHLRNHERLEEKRDKRKEALNVAHEKVEAAGAAGVECEAEGLDFQYMLETAERKLEYHEHLLRWIEQERLVMVHAQPPSVEEDNGNQDSALKAVGISAKSDRRKRQPKVHEVLGEVRVSKPEPRKRNSQHQKRKAPEARLAFDDSGPPQSSVSRNVEKRGSKPRSTKERTALSQTHPQRVFKDKRFANTSVAPAMQLTQVGPKRAPGRARPKRQQSPQWPQPAVVARTKSGRVSRKPEFFVPDKW